jgi:hypothetical protein
MAMLRVAPGLATDLPEYQVKAAMLYNVAKFVEWQGAKTDTPMQVCILGNNPFGAALYSLRGKVVHGRQLNVRQVSRPAEIGACQILYISSSERRSLPSIIGDRGLPGVLTVSDMDRFASGGGVVGFVEVDGKIRLEVNLEAAQQANLKISSQLLKLARIVREGGQ